jgi:Tir chaperone protein (CesT) family
MLETFIKQLAGEMELQGSLATQVQGVFALPLEEHLSVMMTDRPPGFTLACSLCPLPKQNEEACLTRLMLGNLFGQGTKGAVLGLNNEGDLLTLTQTIDYNATYKEFRDILEDFVNSVDFWLAEVDRYK